MKRGDRVTVSRYHGCRTGIVRAVLAGHVTVDLGSHRETFDTSRRKIEVI